MDHIRIKESGPKPKFKERLKRVNRKTGCMKSLRKR